MKWFERLGDHRLLPFFVAFSMAVGILIGKVFGISQYQLTPPITAITSILQGSYDFTIANTLALGVVVGLFLMMYPAMTNVRFEELGKAFRSPRQLLLVVIFNFAAWPFLMWGLAKLLLGDVPFDVFLVGESVALYLGLPLFLGFLTRRVGISRLGEDRFERFRHTLHGLSILGLLFTLVVMFGLKGDAIVETPLIILRIAAPMTLFFIIAFNTVYLLGWRLGFNFEDAVACAFNGTGRDFEIAIAIAITAFNPLVALATVVGPLIEVPVMLALVALAQTSRRHLFHTIATCPLPVHGCCPEAELLLKGIR